MEYFRFFDFTIILLRDYFIVVNFRFDLMKEFGRICLKSRNDVLD